MGLYEISVHNKHYISLRNCTIMHTIRWHYTFVRPSGCQHCGMPEINMIS